MGIEALAVGVALELAVEDRSRHQRTSFRAQHVLDDLALRREDPAHAADMSDRRWRVHLGVAQGEPQLVLELAAARLHDDEPLDAGEQSAAGRRSGTARA